MHFQKYKGKELNKFIFLDRRWLLHLMVATMGREHAAYTQRGGDSIMQRT